MTDRKYVISLYDYTGEALRPWAEAGYYCIAYDIQHEDNGFDYKVLLDTDMLTYTTSERLTKFMMTCQAKT